MDEQEEENENFEDLKPTNISPSSLLYGDMKSSTGKAKAGIMLLSELHICHETTYLLRYILIQMNL